MDQESRSLLIRGAVALVAVGAFLSVRLRERAKPQHERDLMAALLASEKLRKKDATAADRAMHDAVMAHASAERIHRADLRSRSASDRKAAAELRRRLLVDLDGIATMRRETAAEAGEGVEASRREMEAEERRLRDELNRVNGMLN